MALISQKIIHALARFISLEASGGILLTIAAILALIWAAVAGEPAYHHFWEQQFPIQIGPWQLALSLHHWVNDGLMVLFFLVIGLEIKREVMTGELSSKKQAALPIFAALGGMVIPALIYSLVAWPGTPIHRGWGIATVTDIAFAIAMVSLLGHRVPYGVKVFLVALAIVDDLGAILTMVLFYSTAIDWQAVAAAGACLAFLVACNRLRLFAPLPYIVGGLGLWLAMLKSGIHPTLAGVLLAVTLPAQPKIKQEQFRTEALAMLGADASGHLTYAGPEEGSLDTERLPRYLENLSNQAQSPMDAWEQRLHPWVTYGIMPLFALANVGMAVSTDRLLATLQDQLGLAIILGLVLGKQLGITGASLLAIRLGWAEKPARATWRHLYGASWLGGIGFTMSLFITHLAFNDPAHVQTAKMAILLAALFAVLGGCLILSFPKPEAAR